MRYAREIRRLWPPLALLLAGWGLQRLAAGAPLAVERYYSRGIYQYLGRLPSFINRHFSFSLGELLLIALVIGLIIAAPLQARRWVRRYGAAREILLAGVRQILWVLGALFLLFLALWGLNYQRPPLGANLGFERREPSVEELEAMSRTVIAAINRDYEAARAGRDWTVRSRLPYDRARLYQLIEEAFEKTQLLGAAARGGYGPPKPVLLSSVMSRLGISGIYSPFTGEPNYNAEQPESELPHSIAHEKAHQRGYAREDEANFIAFLVCIGADDPYVRYAGYLRGLRLLSPLAGKAPPERFRAVSAALAPGPRADLQASAEFWRRARSPVFSPFAERANNAYLKANQVASGIRNYGEVVALMIGYYLTYPAALEAASADDPKRELIGRDPR
jgi:hypothetical protein